MICCDSCRQRINERLRQFEAGSHYREGIPTELSEIYLVQRDMCIPCRKEFDELMTTTASEWLSSKQKEKDNGQEKSSEEDKQDS